MIEKTKSVVIETIERVKAENSPYFKGVQKIGLGIMGLSAAVKLVGIIFPPLLPVSLVSFAWELFGYGAMMAGFSQLTKKK